MGILSEYDTSSKRIIIDKYNNIMERRAFNKEGSSGHPPHLQSRKLTRIPYNELRPFLINDIEAILSRYIHHVVRKSEITRTFGDKEEHLNKLVKKMAFELKQAADIGDKRSPISIREAVDEVYELIDNLNGKSPRFTNPTAERLRRAVLNTMTMIYLPLVVLASLPEFVTPALLGGLQHYPIALARGIADGINEATRAADKLIRGKNAKYGKTKWRKNAELMGLTSQYGMNSAFNDRFGTTSSKLTATFMRFSLLEQLTNIQRIIANELALAKIKRLLKSNDKQAFLELKDFDLNEKPTELAIKMAAQRFANIAVTTPNFANKPKIMTHPVGALIFQFNTFISVFSNTLLKTVLKNIYRYPKIIAKIQFVVPAIIMIAIVYYAQYLRDWIKYGEFEPKFRDYDDLTGRILDAADRAGLTGSASSLYQFANPYRYGYMRGKDKIFNKAGPAIGTAAKIYDIIDADDNTSGSKRAAKIAAQITPVANAHHKMRAATEDFYRKLLE